MAEALSQISQVSSENIAVSSKTDKLLKHFAHVLKSKQDRIKIAISADNLALSQPKIFDGSLQNSRPGIYIQFLAKIFAKEKKMEEIQDVTAIGEKGKV